MGNPSTPTPREKIQNQSKIILHPSSDIQTVAAISQSAATLGRARLFFVEQSPTS